MITHPGAVLVLNYLLVAWVCLGMLAGIAVRAADPTWSSALLELRWKYDAFGLAIAGYGVPVAFGLNRRSEWARILAVSLCGIIASTYVGTSLFASCYWDVPIASVLRAEGVVTASLAAINAFALTRPGFREAYARASGRFADVE